MKNDISFVLDTKLSLYEHQSTVNRNMPLRDLMYVAKVFEGLVIHRDLYSSKLIQLPSPRFITFYNGLEEQPERREYHHSDAYEVRDNNPALELIVTQLNINPGYNTELMEQCPTLCQYMRYVEKIRTYEQHMTLEEAVEKAVDECIREDGEKSGFIKGEESGFIKGEESGMLTKLISQIIRKLQKGKSPEQIAEELEEDIDLVREICKCAASFAPKYDVGKICEAMLKKKRD